MNGTFIWELRAPGSAPGPALSVRPAGRGLRPRPRFAAVVCKNIERSGQDTFNALKLEKEPSAQGIVLFAERRRQYTPGYPRPSGFLGTGPVGDDS